MKNRAKLIGFLVASLASLIGAGCSKGPPAHGTLLLIALSNTVPATTQNDTIVRAAEVLRKRLALMNVRRAVVEASSNDFLRVTLPKLPSGQLQSCREAIEYLVRLEFRMVHPESEMLVREKITEPGYELLKLEQKQMVRGVEQTLVSELLVNKQPERGLTGRFIRRAQIVRDVITKRPKISIELDPAGTEIFHRITTEFKPAGQREHRLAIVLNGRLISAPAIKSPISGGKAEISGNFTMKEAFDLVDALENPLDVPLRIVDERDF